ncbi:ATP-dependent DNA helicase PIF1 [Trifolium repens]|nr:ATP-dependent DNA helicase PIF1 [Trifolium repens]
MMESERLTWLRKNQPKLRVATVLGNNGTDLDEIKQYLDCSLLTDEQKVIFHKIMTAVENQQGGVFFLHGYGGTGKTFMWRTLSSALRSKCKIVLTVASSGIASLLLPGVGEGTLNEPNDGVVEIKIPQEFLIMEFDDPILGIINNTFPNLMDNYMDYDYLSSRAILASTIEVVDKINSVVLGLLPGEEVEYLSADSLDRSEITEDAKVWKSHFFGYISNYDNFF